jgi:hypothetical protein
LIAAADYDQAAQALEHADAAFRQVRRLLAFATTVWGRALIRGSLKEGLSRLDEACSRWWNATHRHVRRACSTAARSPRATRLASSAGPRVDARSRGLADTLPRLGGLFRLVGSTGHT